MQAVKVSPALTQNTPGFGAVIRGRRPQVRRNGALSLKHALGRCTRGSAGLAVTPTGPRGVDPDGDPQCSAPLSLWLLP